MHRCSCGVVECPAPGAHPARSDWACQATGSATAVRRMWQMWPTASILLPTGHAFDTISVPETAGFLALARMERMELALGPVTLAPSRRMEFFVLPGAAAKAPGLIRSLGWSLSPLDLSVRGEGAYVAARHAVRVQGGRAVGQRADTGEPVAAGRRGADPGAGVRVRPGPAGPPGTP